MALIADEWNEWKLPLHLSNQFPIYRGDIQELKKKKSSKAEGLLGESEV